MTLGGQTQLAYRVRGSKEYPEWAVEGTARVIGLERVIVPAGAFDTFKIEVSGRYTQTRENGRKGAGTFRHFYWYSPEVKREVLREMEITKWDGTIESRGRYVLMDYTVR
jgi:hypothetical protein